jgi:hypothetical protein
MFTNLSEPLFNFYHDAECEYRYMCLVFLVLFMPQFQPIQGMNFKFYNKL